MPVPTLAPLALGHGAVIPRLGLGTWPLRGAEAERTVARALDAGYRLVDTAYAYGNERDVGRGLRASGVPRDELFVTSKLNGEWHGEREAQEACARSLEQLGLEQLDLFLIHWPLPRRDRYVEAWRGMIRLLEDGSVRAIGVSNFKPAHLQRLLDETGVTPDVNQIELNPYVSRAAARAFHAEHGIVTESYSPLGRGGRLLEDPAIVRVAERQGRTPAQVVLRWHLELGLVAIPKSRDPERLRENLEALSFELPPEDVAALSALDQGEAAATDSDVAGH
jgi:2,5-diketo-D-gluconate reductase A